MLHISDHRSFHSTTISVPRCILFRPTRVPSSSLYDLNVLTLDSQGFVSQGFVSDIPEFFCLDELADCDQTDESQRSETRSLASEDICRQTLMCMLVGICSVISVSRCDEPNRGWISRAWTPVRTPPPHIRGYPACSFRLNSFVPSIYYSVYVHASPSSR